MVMQPYWLTFHIGIREENCQEYHKGPGKKSWENNSGKISRAHPKKISRAQADIGSLVKNVTTIFTWAVIGSKFIIFKNPDRSWKVWTYATTCMVQTWPTTEPWSAKNYRPQKISKSRGFHEKIVPAFSRLSVLFPSSFPLRSCGHFHPISMWNVWVFM